MEGLFWATIAASIVAYVSPSFIEAWRERKARRNFARIIAQAQNWRNKV